MDSDVGGGREISPLDEVYLLVSSLNKAEKRVFTQLSAQGQANLDQGYMRLFRAFNGEIDLEKADLPSLGSVSGRQVRSQLRQNVFRSLRFQHEQSQNLGKLEGGMRDVELLFTRGLYHQAQKRLKQVQRAAEKAEQLSIQLKVVQKEIQIQFDTQQYGGIEGLDALHDQEVALEVELQKERKARQLFQQVYHLVRRRIRVGSEERQLKIKALWMGIEAMRGGENPRFWTQIYLTTASGVLALMEGDMSKTETYLETLMQRWYFRQDLIADDFPLWLTGMRSFLSFLFLNKQFGRFHTELKLFQSWPDRFPLYRHLFRFNLMDLELLYHMNTGELTPALGLVDAIQGLLDQDGDRLPPSKHLQLSYNVAILFFLHSEFKLASRWCRRIDMMDRIDHRIDLQEFSKLLSLFSFYERGDLDLLHYQLASVQRYFKRRGKLTTYEALLLEKVRELGKGIPLLEVPAFFSSFHNQLVALAGLQAERKWVGIQEILLWTQSRAEGRSLKSIFVKKSQEPWNE